MVIAGCIFAFVAVIATAVKAFHHVSQKTNSSGFKVINGGGGGGGSFPVKTGLVAKAGSIEGDRS